MTGLAQLLYIYMGIATACTLNCLNFIAIDVNECSNGMADCVADATCINTAEGFMCLCPIGYTGDGRLSGTMCSGLSAATSYS